MRIVSLILFLSLASSNLVHAVVSEADRNPLSAPFTPKDYFGSISTFSTGPVAVWLRIDSALGRLSGENVSSGLVPTASGVLSLGAERIPMTRLSRGTIHFFRGNRSTGEVISFYPSVESYIAFLLPNGSNGVNLKTLRYLTSPLSNSNNMFLVMTQNSPGVQEGRRPQFYGFKGVQRISGSNCTMTLDQERRDVGGPSSPHTESPERWGSSSSGF